MIAVVCWLLLLLTSQSINVVPVKSYPSLHLTRQTDLYFSSHGNVRMPLSGGVAAGHCIANI